MPTNTTEIKQRLWDAADDRCANSQFKASQYVKGQILP
jgi:hypothetical protein